MVPFQTKEIEDYVTGLTDLQRELVLAIRDAVLSADDRMQEVIKWSSIAFFNKKNICGFRVAKAHVTLLFMEGTSLTDFHGILEGSGAKARTYKLTKASEIKTKALTELVKESLDKGM
ncbi:MULTISPECIES: DUF1801 domain-containing protein [Flavobacteriaceae]|uniref:DUF1801 domain-containing protein n=1 Tax=Flavobacteriaceae TaxID=49546 RepID=UPI0014931D80|nr:MULTISPECIES: DUF1801 domain-containing protein [Allomuricauda]MDC6366694.1 DUF1801 domain-containing protein [Muricauda sp. AC10]